MSGSDDPGVIDALGLLTRYGDEVVLRTVRDTHRAVAARVGGVLGRLTGGRSVAPLLVHDVIASAVYTSIGAGLAGSAIALRAAGAGGPGRRLDDGTRGRFARAAVNGLIGDRLAEEGSRLAIPTAVRHDARDVPLDTQALGQAFEAPSGAIVVMLHGLGEDESCWGLHRERAGTTYVETLRALGWTPVPLRFNTGRSIRENGVEVAGVVRDLTHHWPVPVTRIAFVGHSMGGLIARAACAVEVGGAESWVGLVTDLLTLGSPHAGAPLAAGVGHGSRLLARLPETSAFGRILDHRSTGIRDLVEGLGHDVPPLPGVRHLLVAGTVTESPRHPVGRFVGDLLVREASAQGRSRREIDLFPDAEVLHVARADHFALLNHPEVHDAMRRWLQ